MPAGIYSAVRKYSVGDYVMTTFAFLGIAIPGFMIALVVAYVQFTVLRQVVGGLFSPEYVDAGWNLGKVLDLLATCGCRSWCSGPAGIGGTIRMLRANLLDELHKPYVVDRARPRPARAPAAAALSGPGGAEPVHLHHRLDPAGVCSAAR